MTETSSAPSLDGVLYRIRYRPGGYNPIEGRIAAAILEDPERFTRDSVVECGTRLAVSGGSIVRFAQRLGFGGVRELKLAVARDLGPSSAPSPGRLASSPFAVRMDQQIRALEAAAEAVDPLAVTRAAAWLAQARHIEVAATGSSSAIAHAMVFSLTAAGVRARHLPDSAEHMAAAALLGSDDVLVAISLSGRTRSTVDAAVRAREAGAEVIAFTASASARLATASSLAVSFDSRIARLADEWPARTALFAIVRATVAEVPDHLAPAEANRRRGQWSSGRFGLRYANE